MPWPTRWADVFGRTAPLLVEIGFGGGHFLVELGRQRPQCNVLGVEISAPSLRRGARKIQSNGLSNVRLFQGHVRLFLQALCAENALTEVYINFPDPWPKAAHQQRRLISDEFLRLLASRMVERGLLEIATDHDAYASHIANCLDNSLHFDNLQPAAFSTLADRSLRTKYEQIALGEGRTCHYFRWRRNSLCVSETFPVPEEFPMPHVLLRSPLKLEEIGRAFRPSVYCEGNVHVRLLESYQSLHDGRLLVEAYINEEPLRQRVGLTIRQRKSGDLVIGLHEMGFPRPTFGIQLAIKHLARWVKSLSPDAEIIQSNLKPSFNNESR